MEIDHQLRCHSTKRDYLARVNDKEYPKHIPLIMIIGMDKNMLWRIHLDGMLRKE